MPGRPGRCGTQHDPVEADSVHQLDGQIREHEGQPGHVVAGVGHDQDAWIALMPVSGVDEPTHDLTQLGGGDRGGVVGRAQAYRVQGRRP